MRELNNLCFQVAVMEKTLESPLDSKEIKPVNPKGNQSWITIERTDAEAEAPILCPPDAKSQLNEKDPDAGEDWGQKEKEATEDEMAGWHHRLRGHESEQGLGDGEGQEGCSPWGCKESDMTEWLKNNKKLLRKRRKTMVRGWEHAKGTQKLTLEPLPHIFFGGTISSPLGLFSSGGWSFLPLEVGTWSPVWSISVRHSPGHSDWFMVRPVM